MRLHEGPAVQHYVMFAVVFCFEEGEGASHKLCIFTQSAIHYEYENLQLCIGNYNLKFSVNG